MFFDPSECLKGEFGIYRKKLFGDFDNGIDSETVFEAVLGLD